MAVRASKRERFDNGCLHLRIGIVLRSGACEIESIHAAVRGHLLKQHSPGMLRQGLDLLLGVFSEDRWPEMTAIAERLEADLLVFVSDERPDRIKEFRSARREHESEGAIYLSGRVPARYKSLNGPGDLRPHFFSGAEDHLGGEDWIDLERGDDCHSARGTLLRVAASQTLDSKQNGFLPCRQIEDFRLQRLAPFGIGDFSDDKALDRMRGVPFLELLVLERIARRVACAHQNMLLTSTSRTASGCGLSIICPLSASRVSVSEIDRRALVSAMAVFAVSVAKTASPSR